MLLIKVIKHLPLIITPAKPIMIFLLLTFGSITQLYAKDENNLTIQFSDKEQAWLNNHTEVNVGFTSNFPPVLIIDTNKQYIGILPDLLALISQHTGINFRIVLSPTWEETLKQGITRKTDMIGMFLPNKEFTPDFDFTDPHFKTHFYIFGPGNIKSPEYKINDLTDKRIGLVGSIRIYKNFIKQHRGLEFISYDDRDSLVTALISGQVDFIIHVSALEYWRQQNRLITFKIVGAIPQLSSDVISGVRTDWPELTSIINKVLASTIKQRRAIVDHWLGYSSNGIIIDQSVQLLDQEKSWISEHPVIRVGFDSSWAPIEFLGENKQPQGITIQYLQHLEKSLGLHFKYMQNQSWPDALKKLEQSQLDILGAVSNNYPKRDLYNLTPSYLSLTKGIFSAEYRGYIEGANALKDKRVVVVEGSSIQTWLKQNYPKIILISAPDITTALKIITRGKAFAFVENHLTASYYIAKSGLTQIRLVGEVAHKHNLTIAVRKDWEILADILRKGLNNISQNERDAIYNKWVSVNYKHSMDLSLLWQVLAAATFILLIILFWNRRLAQEITHRRQIESALKLAKNEAEKATEAKTEFLANMSHEIRTPMNAVIGMAQLIQQTEITDQQQEYLNIMDSSSKVLMEVIDNILDLSKVEAGMLSLDIIPFNLKKTVQKVISDLELQATKKSLDLSLNINTEIPASVEGDPHKLEQILRNLVSNAIKFTKQGNIDLSVDEVEFDCNTISLRFTIKDTGIGISQKQQQKLFIPFSQADSSITREYGGTGLGLIISQRLAKLMDSKITLKSKLGQGSSLSLVIKFKIITQTQEDQLSSKKQANLLSPIPKLMGAKALLVEDDELNQYIANQYLISFGVSVTNAENGIKALEVLKKQSFDIVFMDIQMPEMDGYEAVRTIRQQNKWSNLPIIAMTAHAFSTERDKCLALGMDDYLTKPINTERLKEMLLKWIKQPNDV